MRLGITTLDTDPDDKEWTETWAPFLTEHEGDVYRALRNVRNREVDLPVLARGVGISANAFERAIERLEEVGLLRVYDEA